MRFSALVDADFLDTEAHGSGQLRSVPFPPIECYGASLDRHPQALPREGQVNALRRDVLEACRLAAENWDAPLILTTQVQLFESLFGRKPSTCP
jgi:hypothetical protein